MGGHLLTLGVAVSADSADFFVDTVDDDLAADYGPFRHGRQGCDRRHRKHPLSLLKPPFSLPLLSSLTLFRSLFFLRSAACAFFFLLCFGMMLR